MSTTKGHSDGAAHQFHWMKRRLYRTGGPALIARSLDRIAAVQYSAGILSPARAVTLEVAGRRTGHLVPFLVVIAEYDHERYLVSMLGNDANWVRNVRAADGRAVLRRGSREQVRLEEVEPADRMHSMIGQGTKVPAPGDPFPCSQAPIVPHGKRVRRFTSATWRPR